MATAQRYDEIYVLWTTIRFLAHLMGKVRGQDLSKYGITVKQAAMLNIINLLGDSATPVSIAKYLIREPSAISNILIRMEKLGLIERIPDAKRQRQVRISITPEGKKKLKVISRRESIHRVMEQLSKEEIKALLDNAVKLRGILLEDLGLSGNRPRPIY